LVVPTKSIRRSNVVTEDELVIAEIESAISHDRMGPNVGAWWSMPGLFGDCKSSMLVPSLWGCIDQNGRAVVFAIAIELASCACPGSLAQALIAPNHFSVVNALANPPFAVGVAVKVIAHQDNAAVMVYHVLIGIHLFGAN